MHAGRFHTEQILAHNLMINQLIATADCSQQTALEASQGSAPWLTFIHLSRSGGVQR